MAGSGVGDFVRHGTDGALVPDDLALARTLLRLAARPDEARAMARASRRHPPTLDWSDVLDQHEQLYAAAREGASRAIPVAGSRAGSGVGLVT